MNKNKTTKGLRTMRLIDAYKITSGEIAKYLGREDVDKAGTYLMQLNDIKKHGELVKSDERKLESLMELHRKESEKYAQS